MTRLTRRAALTLGTAALVIPPVRAADLSGLRAARPRLLTTPDDLAGLEQRLAADEMGQKWRAALLREADRLLTQKPVDYTFEPRRPVLLPTSREVLKRMENLGVAWLLTRDARYAQRIALELRRVCGFDTWHPPHFLDVAEMTMAVAIAYDWTHDALSPEDRAMARKALVDFGLKPGLEEYRRGTFWTKALHNWNLVCNGGLTAGALAIADEEPELAARVLDAGIPSSRLAFASYAPDGGWEEGPGYWDYATQYAVFMTAALRSALGHDFGLSDSPGFAACGMFRLHVEGPTGKTFNFADGGEGVRHTPALMWLARRFDKPLYAWLAGRNATSTGTGVLWFHPQRKAPEELDAPTGAYFRHAEIAALRGAWGDRNTMFVALKAGDNAANHSNLDIGTFVLDAGSERFAVDLGGDDYSLPDYFGKLRFTYYRTATIGQNTLAIEAANQPVKAKTRIGAFGANPNFAFAVADTGPAYPEATQARRGVALLNGRIATLVDEIDLPAGRTARWQMHTRATVTLNGSAAQLQQGKATLHARIVAPAGASFTVQSASPPAPQDPNKGVSKLCVDIAGGRPQRLVVAFALDTPPDDAALAPIQRPLAQWA